MIFERPAATTYFLAQAGWENAERVPLAGDASTRRYERLTRGRERAILMNAPPKAESPICPPLADPAERRALGYNARARLAGADVTAFVAIAQALSARGFSAPRILAFDAEDGFVLMEDLGEGLFARVLGEGETAQDEETLYAGAVDVLGALYRSSFAPELGVADRTWPLLSYDTEALLAEVDLFLEWFVARRSGRTLDAGYWSAWTEAWSAVLQPLADQPRGLALRDYHAENLLWLPDRSGPGRVGLLDFQDAVMGHPAYDLVSLLEDARRDVSPRLFEPMKARFAHAAGLTDTARLDEAFAVLAAQRNAKILGVFARLAIRDGKPDYLALLPRVARHFVKDLSHPALRDIADLVGPVAPTLFEAAA